MKLHKTLSSISVLTVALILLLLPQVAHADSIIFQLTDPVQTVAPGSTILFSGTVYTTGNAATIYFNGADDGVASPLSIDDTVFFATFPFSLDPDMSYTGPLFSITIPSNALGAYDGHFTIQGGADAQANNNLGSAAFEVDVTSPVPEPGTILLLLTGLAAMPLLMGLRAVPFTRVR